ncbi:hypothetical protein BEI46_08580 [Aliivibrio fischeri]|uniref:polysaccharide deacetylase family protein n=1 Tax=Aliivibrio fischeri TaxID=668 RepID=UPI00084CD730|nr:polysaccharide deacetylase family protein [Aliivibrio fischeri]OED56335.1 hypothetical protein BEI46_08580 [Aliivibrio fischeri]
MCGNFIISLDYEKAWGFNDLLQEKQDFDKFLAVDGIVKEKLSLFHEFNIKVTWAIVTGMIDIRTNNELFECNSNDSFFTNCLLLNNVPENTYKCSIDEIVLKGHEVASHTHTHVYCDDDFSQKKYILSDIIKSIETINNISNFNCSTIIFPRNQVNIEILKELKPLGVKCFRGNNSTISDSVTDQTKKTTKVLRYLDSYFPIYPTSYSNVSIHDSGLINIPASRFLRITDYKILNIIHLNRIKREMTNAAVNGYNYHLWWHPHNFINKEIIGFYVLKEILKHFEFLKVQYDFKSSTMEEVYREYTL